MTVVTEQSSDPASTRIIVMGTGPFAVPLFRALLHSPYRVVALVTQPARASSSHGKAPPVNPMRSLAESAGLPVLDPESINTDESRRALAAYEPTLLVVADYGQILVPETLAVARLGGINLHGSLLPKYRGAAPINWALYRGDAETGVTVIHMTPQVDAGPLLAQARVAIGPEETAPELEARLAELGAPLIVETVGELLRGAVVSLPQDKSLACGARRLRKTDGDVDWTRSAQEIARQVRALEPWPRTSTHWLRRDAPPLRLILGRVAVQQEGHFPPPEALPGTVLPGGKQALRVATGDGVLTLLELQPAGKRMCSAGEFLRGYTLLPGEQLGSVAT